MGLVSFIVAYCYASDIDNFVLNKFNQTIKDLYGHPNSEIYTFILNFIQYRIKCCGENNFKNWINTYWFDHRSLIEIENDTQVPQSCCVDYDLSYQNSTSGASSTKIYCNGQSSIPIENDNYFNEGCYLKIQKLISAKYNYILLSTVLFAFMQFSALISAIKLIISKIKPNPMHPPYLNIESEYEIQYTSRRDCKN